MRRPHRAQERRGSTEKNKRLVLRRRRCCRASLSQRPCVADVRFDFSFAASRRDRVIFLLSRECLPELHSNYSSLAIAIAASASASISVSLALSLHSFPPFYLIHDSPASSPYFAIRFSRQRRQWRRQWRERRKVYIKDALPICVGARAAAQDSRRPQTQARLSFASDVPGTIRHPPVGRIQLKTTRPAPFFLVSSLRIDTSRCSAARASYRPGAATSRRIDLISATVLAKLAPVVTGPRAS